MDLQAGDLLPADVDPIEVSEELERRYRSLWDELTREELFQPEDQRHRIAKRLRRLNELGFDADEVELIADPDGTRLRVRTRVAESGQSSRQLFRQTGISAEEHQARRLLNDIASFRAYLEQQRGGPVSETVAAHRWLEDVYDPVVAAIPAACAAGSRRRRSSTRSSSTAGTCRRRPGGTSARPRRPQSYFDTVLPAVPQPLSAVGPRSRRDSAAADTAQQWLHRHGTEVWPVRQFLGR